MWMLNNPFATIGISCLYLKHLILNIRWTIDLWLVGFFFKIETHTVIFQMKCLQLQMFDNRYWLACSWTNPSTLFFHILTLFHLITFQNVAAFQNEIIRQYVSHYFMDHISVIFPVPSTLRPTLFFFCFFNPVTAHIFLRHFIDTT